MKRLIIRVVRELMLVWLEWRARRAAASGLATSQKLLACERALEHLRGGLHGGHNRKRS